SFGRVVGPRSRDVRERPARFRHCRARAGGPQTARHGEARGRTADVRPRRHRKRTQDGLTSPTPEKGSAMARYSADHVGSFLRPPELLQARVAHDEGRIDEGGLPGAGGRATGERGLSAVLDLQRQAGVDVSSDGEYRRAMWLTGLPAAVDGFGPGAMLNIKNWRGRPLPYVPRQTGIRPPADR